MRQCPTLTGDERPLIAHSIAECLCVERQREFYHKCHRCVFRGKPAGYQHEGSAGRNGTALVGQNGAAGQQNPADLGR
ncbi:MAG: hypothetical protein H6836_01305 [Planctomycetes bacterium]|nr:hypothetical protein [Planctomycetota bacterium]MCB9888181.1 hypothetical protein [Planctomycetota bacterium]